MQACSLNGTGFSYEQYSGGRGSATHHPPPTPSENRNTFTATHIHNFWIRLPTATLYQVTNLFLCDLWRFRAAVVLPGVTARWRCSAVVSSMAAPAESMTEESSEDVPLEKTYTVEGKLNIEYTMVKHIFLNHGFC